MKDYSNFVEQYFLTYEGREYAADIFLYGEAGYRGVILGLSGEADFYGKDEESLLAEFRNSLPKIWG